MNLDVVPNEADVWRASAVTFGNVCQPVFKDSHLSAEEAERAYQELSFLQATLDLSTDTS